MRPEFKATSEVLKRLTYSGRAGKSLRNTMMNLDQRAIDLEKLRRASKAVRQFCRDEVLEVREAADIANIRANEFQDFKCLHAFEVAQQKTQATYCKRLRLRWVESVLKDCDIDEGILDLGNDEEQTVVISYIIDQIHAQRRSDGEPLGDTGLSAEDYKAIPNLARKLDQTCRELIGSTYALDISDSTLAAVQPTTQQLVLATQDWRYARWFLRRFHEQVLNPRTDLTVEEQAEVENLRITLAILRGEIFRELQGATFTTISEVQEAIKKKHHCEEWLTVAMLEPTDLLVEGVLVDAEQLIMNSGGLVKRIHQLLVPQLQEVSK